MNTRVIVCGGRNFGDKNLCFEMLNLYLGKYKNPEIVSGNTKGADSFGEEYAKEHGLKVTVFKPNWKQYGRAAGPIRNREMLLYALEESAVIIAFWDGQSKGTMNMIDQARKAGAIIHVVNY